MWILAHIIEPFVDGLDCSNYVYTGWVALVFSVKYTSSVCCDPLQARNRICIREPLKPRSEFNFASLLFHCHRFLLSHRQIEFREFRETEETKSKRVSRFLEPVSVIRMPAVDLTDQLNGWDILRSSLAITISFFGWYLSLLVVLSSHDPIWGLFSIRVLYFWIQFLHILVLFFTSINLIPEISVALIIFAAILV